MQSSTLSLTQAYQNYRKIINYSISASAFATASGAEEVLVCSHNVNTRRMKCSYWSNGSVLVSASGPGNSGSSRSCKVVLALHIPLSGVWGIKFNLAINGQDIGWSLDVQIRSLCGLSIYPWVAKRNEVIEWRDFQDALLTSPGSAGNTDTTRSLHLVI